MPELCRYLSIVKQYEERETAAKIGRPVFLEMLKALRDGKAHGLIIHKIDRSARNLKDWADLGSLIDSGIEVHFANESLDLKSTRRQTFRRYSSRSLPPITSAI